MLNLEQEKTTLTKQVLKCIADHLSGRYDCRGIEYTVTIGTDVNTQFIAFEPTRFVFPNRYKRCETDKINIMFHVIREHFPQLYVDTDSMFGTYVDTSKLIKGVYVYQSSVDNKRRRWKRIK